MQAKRPAVQYSHGSDLLKLETNDSIMKDIKAIVKKVKKSSRLHAIFQIKQSDVSAEGSKIQETNFL